MNHLKNIYIILVCSLVFFTCTEETTLETDFEPQTIIFGNLSSGTHNLSVNVSQTVPVDSKQSIPVNDAKVVLYTKSTNEEPSAVLNDFIIIDGVYVSTQPITAVVGNYYWIEVTLADGTLFRSSEEKLLDIVAVENHSFIDDNLRLEISDPESEVNFYITTIYYNSESESSMFTVTSDALFNGNDDAFIEIENIFDNTQFDIEFSNVSFNTYKFFEKLLVQMDTNSIGDDSGPVGLFSSPPVNLKGNIINTSNNKTAIGHFGVLAVAEYSE